MMTRSSTTLLLPFAKCGHIVVKYGPTSFRRVRRPGPGQRVTALDVPVDHLGEQFLDALGVLPAEALHELLGTVREV